MGDHLSARAVQQNRAGALADSIVLPGLRRGQIQPPGSTLELYFGFEVVSSAGRLGKATLHCDVTPQKRSVPLLYASFLRPLLVFDTLLIPSSESTGSASGWESE